MDDYGNLMMHEAVITRFPETVTHRGLDLLDGVEECEACHVGLELVDGGQELLLLRLHLVLETLALVLQHLAHHLHLPTADSRTRLLAL
jgi:hypothetical protein